MVQLPWDIGLISKSRLYVLPDIILSFIVNLNCSFNMIQCDGHS
jgi:hypothetical protein